MSQISASSPILLTFDECEEGRTHLDFAIGAEEIELEDTYFKFPRSLQVDLTVHRSIETFTLDGRIRSAVRGECCRCLAEAEEPLAVEFKLLLQRRHASADELEAVAEDEEIEIVDPGKRGMDLGDRIRDAVILELPVRIYCKTDCKGLCPQCGQNLNQDACSCAEKEIDPRWEGLKKVQFS